MTFLPKKSRKMIYWMGRLWFLSVPTQNDMSPPPKKKGELFRYVTLSMLSVATKYMCRISCYSLKQCWSESGLGLGLNGWVRVRVRTRVRTRDSTLVDSDSDSDSTSVDSDSSAVDSDSGLMDSDSDSDSTQVDSDSQWVQVSLVRNIQGKFKLSYAIMDEIRGRNSLNC